MLYQRKKNSTKIKLKRSKKQKALECYCESFDGSEDARKNIKKKKKKKKKGNRSRDPRLLSLSRSDRSGIFFFCCRAEEGKD